jgi:hypothetical protein
MIGLSIVLALAAVALLLAVTSAQTGSQGHSLLVPPPAAGVVSSTISYQGRLLDSNDDPVSGTRTMTFRLYDQPSGGTALWSQTQNVSVNEGLFTVYLDVDPILFDGRTLWLGVQVQGDAQEMQPRQPILPAPYALSLRPGAIISGVLAGNENTAMLYAINKGSGAVGLYANGERAAVYAWSTGGAGVLATSQTGFGGEFSSTDSSAVYGGTASNAPAIWGENSGAGAGVKGTSVGGVGYGVWGQGPTVGVHGETTNGFGVSGSSTNDAGVLGESANGPGGYFTSTNGKRHLCCKHQQHGRLFHQHQRRRRPRERPGLPHGCHR